MQTSINFIDWWHEEIGAEQFEHNGLLNTYIIIPNLVYGISERLNLAFNITFGARVMHWHASEESIHHRDESTLSNFRNAQGSILGDSRIILRYLFNESGSEIGKRFYLGTGLVIPGSSVLTADPFFLDGELYKSHRHFSLSSGSYKGIIEGQLFLKRNINPVFLGGFFVIEQPFSENKYGYSPSSITTLSLSASFMRYDQLMSSYDFGLTFNYSSKAKWNNYYQPNSESFAISPSFGFLFNTKYGAVSINIQKPFMLYGSFVDNEGDLDQRSDVWQFSFSLRLKNQIKEK
jgi:hypothetical protein